MQKLDELYHEALMEVYRHPLNKSKPKSFDEVWSGNNPLCGDKVEIFVKWDKNGKVKNVGWQGDGCAISQVATSLFSDHIKGRTSDEIKELSTEKMLEMLGIKKMNPTRMRCATLPLEAMKTPASSRGRGTRPSGSRR